MRGGLRAGSVVRSGPSGSPPAGLRAWETIASSTPTTLGLARPAGSTVMRRDGLASWYKISGSSWFEMGNLGVWQSRMLYVANTADPSVDGLMANVGVIAQSNNGAKAWMKYGSGNYDWRLLNESHAHATADEDCVEMGADVAAAASQRLTLTALVNVKAAGYLILTLDGAAAVGSGAHNFGGVFDNAPTVTVGYAGYAGLGTIRMDVGPSIGGVRSVAAICTSRPSGTTGSIFSSMGAKITSGAIAASVGLRSYAGALQIGAGSVLEGCAWS